MSVGSFPPIPHWPGNVLHVQPSTASARSSTQGHQGPTPLLPFPSCSAGTLGSRTAAPLSLMHHWSGQMGGHVSPALHTALRCGQRWRTFPELEMQDGALIYTFSKCLP